ncbi:MAG TPA: hypothetical protein VND87_07045 [Stellaceae bacterium]|nr:hypothetical protein [Stellaceae bacterium]
MNYANFFERSGETPKITSYIGFMTMKPVNGQRVTRPGFFDIRFISAVDTKTAAPLALKAAKRNIGDWFIALATQWTRETGHVASIARRRQHPAYKNIIKLGKSAVPLLLDSLRTRPDYWFPALRELTGEDPVQDDDRGYYDRMAAAWLQWGKDRQLIA